MTYCFAWKDKNDVYMIADSVSSSLVSNEVDEKECSSMGENYGLYNSYFIEETDVKIHVINNYAMAFAGNLEVFYQLKKQMDLMSDTLQLNEIIQYIKNYLSSSENSNQEVLLVSHNSTNKLFYINSKTHQEIDTFISIGSGKKIEGLDTSLNNFVGTLSLYNYDALEDIVRMKLSMTASLFQIISLKNNFLDYGVGGTITGVCIHETIEWADDFLYFFYDENLKDKKLINVLTRKNTLITGSDYSQQTKMFRLPDSDKKYSEHEIRKLKRYNIKNMSSHIPKYIIFYSFFYNVIHFYDTQRVTQTHFVKLLARRSNIEVKWEMFLDPDFIEYYLLAHKKNENDFLPDVYRVLGLESDYKSRQDLIDSTGNFEDVDYSYDDFDFPFETVKVDFKEIENYFNNTTLDDYENLVIINMNYFEKKINELIFFYKGLNLNFDYNNVLNRLYNFLNEQFDIEFRFMFFWTRESTLDNLIFEYEDRYIEEKHECELFINKLVHNYYTKENYFHLNKIVIVDDSAYYNELFSILPRYNHDVKEADIFIVRNLNHDTEVSHSPFYFSSDILFSKFSGASEEVLKLWSPDDYEIEEEKEFMLSYLNRTLEKND